MRTYSNFSEIEQDLRVLKLKKQIGEEELRLSLNGVKGGFNAGLSPVSSIANMAGSIFQKVIVSKLVGSIFGMKRVKEVKTGKEMKV